MSNFYEDASVVMVPSGYKTSKVYSSVPDDGSADLTFSRSNDTATRVGPDGLIEKVRTNELTYSNDFSNAAWTKAGVTITSGQADPNGGTSAFKIDFASGGNYYIGQFYLGAGSKTNSIWLRADSAVQIGLSNGTDLITGPTLTTSWVRYQAPQTSASSSGGIQIDNYFGVTTPQLAITIYAYQAQLETGDIATDYIETTTSAVSVGPLANIPRLDYSGGANSPSLLLEPQRTNLNTYSEDISQSSQYLATRVTISKNSVVSPDGYTNADKIVQDPSNTSWGGVAQGISPAGLVTLSVFAKKIDNDYIAIIGHNSIPTAAWFNIANGTVGTTEANVTSASIEAYPNGWYRCSITASNANRFSVFHASGDNTTSAPVNSETALWGFQQEDNVSYATSYIPTLSAAVTRGAESCSKTSATALIGQTEGTMFAEIDWDGRDKDSMFFTLSDGTTNNRMHIGYDESANRFYFNIRVANVQQALIVQNTPASGIKKIAAAYKANDVVLYINGVQIGSSTSTSVAATNQIDIGNYYSTGYQYPVKQNLLFPTRLSDADLSLLTTL